MGLEPSPMPCPELQFLLLGSTASFYLEDTPNGHL